MAGPYRFTTKSRKIDRAGELSWGGEHGWENTIDQIDGIAIKDGQAAPQTGPAGPTTGLVAQWGFDNEATHRTIEDSVGGYDAVLSGGSYVAEQRGKVVHFNGSSDYGTVSIPITQSFTTSIWGRSDQSNSWSDSGVLFSARDGNGFIIHPQSSEAAWRGYVLDTVTDSYHAIGESAHPISDITTWHLYTITYDHSTGTAKAYCDGVKVGSSTFSITRSDDTISARFGRDTADLGDRYLSGSLDDARLYSRALSETEVQNLYDETK